jgi:hypothetical protein
MRNFAWSELDSNGVLLDAARVELQRPGEAHPDFGPHLLHAAAAW